MHRGISRARDPDLEIRNANLKDFQAERNKDRRTRGGYLTFRYPRVQYFYSSPSSGHSFAIWLELSISILFRRCLAQRRIFPRLAEESLQMKLLKSDAAKNKNKSRALGGHSHLQVSST